MSDTHVGEHEPEAVRPPHAGRHPSPKEYVRIAVILAIITAAEVAIYYIEGIREFLIPLLLLFSIIKFTLVVMWFMHLKFDHPLFSTMFVMGFLLAATIFAVALATIDGKLV
jgi:cytochrome c oxidase subunit 4